MQAATAITPASTASPLPGLGQITRDPSGRYAFPLAADPAYFTWTYQPPSFPNTVAIEARLGLTQAEFAQVTRATVVAVTSGVARTTSGEINGLGYIVQGDDGTDYAFASLDQQWIADGTRVSAGQALGTLGSTGSAARFGERHLRFWLGERDSLWDNRPPTRSAADWIEATFGLRWTERPAPQVADSWPSGWPVVNPNVVVVTPWSRARDQGLPEAAIELGFIGDPPPVPQMVYATLDGVVNVMRWTDAYGTRIQITNDTAQFTILLSGLDSWLVTDGQAVSKGQIIGQWTPTRQPHLHYMILQNGVNIDPQTTLR